MTGWQARPPRVSPAGASGYLTGADGGRHAIARDALQHAGTTVTGTLIVPAKCERSARLADKSPCGPLAAMAAYHLAQAA